MKKFKVKLKDNRYGVRWDERKKALINRMVIIANKVVELGGTIEVRKHFDLRYPDSTMFVYLEESKISELGSLNEVENTRVV